MDVKTRKRLAMFRVLRKKGSVARVYMKRKDGAIGLISVVECVREEQFGLFTYVKKSEEWMLGAVNMTLQVGESKHEHKKHVDKKRK